MRRCSASAAAISAEVDRLLPELINVGYTESQLYASGLHEKVQRANGLRRQRRLRAAAASARGIRAAFATSWMGMSLTCGRI